MESSSIYVTPKRKFSPNTSSSSQEASPEEKRAQESYSPDVKTSGDEDEVMAALKLAEGVTKKLDLILARQNSLDSRMEELHSTVKGLQSKISSMEIDIDSVKDKQKGLDENFTHMENNSKFVDEHIEQLESSLQTSKDEIDECHKKILYLEAYSRREYLKFEGIPEVVQHNATSNQSEDTERILVDFLENVLAIDDAKNIEFQRVHTLGKRKNDRGNDGRTIIARFLRFSDRERVFKQGRRLKDTKYRMFEDIPKELHQKRKAQMERLKEARKEGKRANFSRSEPDKLYIDGKYVKM